MKLRDLIIEQEYQAFVKYVDSTNYLTEATTLNELSFGVKDKIDFAKKVAGAIRTKVKDVLKLLKNSKVFKFLSKIGWSFETIFKLVKKGFGYYKQVLDAIADFVAKSKVGKWTEEKLKQLDNFLQNHPKTRRIAGIAVAAILVYIWFNMTFTGDFVYDFDMTDMLNALAGKFSLATLFAGTAGTKLLLLFATGAIGLSFPWPGAASKQFIGAVVGSLASAARTKIHGV